MAMIAHKCPDVAVKVVDVNAERIAAWESDALPVFEPGLDDIVRGARGRNLFFSEAPDNLLKRCILFGETLLFNTAESYLDDLYRRDLQRLLRGARAVAMRDVFSALHVATVRDEFPSVRLGVDCALLLRPEERRTPLLKPVSSRECNRDGAE